MGIWITSFRKDYLREIIPAFWHALALTDTLVIGVFILAGGSATAFGLFGGHTEHPSWWIAFAIFLMSLLVLLVRIPYALYSKQRAKINELQDKLARIREDRPLSFTGLSIEHFVQRHPPYGPVSIDRIELGFENTGGERLSLTITDLYFEWGGRKIPILLPAGADRYNLLAREEVGYGFDVPGLEVQLRALQATMIRFGFRAAYDNVPPLKARGMERVLDCGVRSVRPFHYDVTIVHQIEF
jgi:hypothetical protein